jgi:nicotinamide phosphoribosyltransferase
MKEFLPVLLKDGYKVGHIFQYPKGTTLVYSNLTPRSSRVEGQDFVIPFGFQYFVKEYLVRQFNENFFDQPLDRVMRIYKRTINNYLGPGAITFDHIEALHKLQYLPLLVKAVPEGLKLPLRVPALTIRNTKDDFFWLTNMLETLMSNVLWLPSTSATTAFRYRLEFEKWAKKTGAPRDFIKWQGHDFSMRGMPGIEAAILSGMSHLLSFTGTDTIPAILGLEEYYGADSDKELVGGSVAATEHSVVCVGTARFGDEEGLLSWLLTEVYPTKIVSYVSDTTDFWGVVGTIIPKLKDIILKRDGKLVVRPDSGDPVKIVCGDPQATFGSLQYKGAVQVLWEVFGGTYTAEGYRVLDSHIGLIYGDSITPERQQAILDGLAAKGFASSNVVLGIGSYTYQHVTRDTYGWAIKATYAEIDGKGYDIFKAPKTDDGTKNSARGLLSVVYDPTVERIGLVEQQSWHGEEQGLLQPIFQDGRSVGRETLAGIRQRIDEQVAA